jgi:glycosyltransferase involved in cell wall biosynthesis
MKILIISQFFYPETGAAPNRIYELGRLFVRSGHRLSVLTTFPNYPKGELFKGYQQSRLFQEVIEGINVYRVPSSISKYSSVLQRTKSYISFAFNAIKNIDRVEKTDIVIGTSGPVFVLAAAYFFSMRWRVPFVADVRDIQSKVLHASGLITGTVLQKLISFTEKFFLQRAKLIIPVTKAYKRELTNILKADKKRFEVIENGMDFNRTGISRTTNGLIAVENRLRQQKERGGRVIAYFGNLGISQRISEVCREFEQNRNDGLILCVIGNGVEEGIVSKIARQNRNIMYHESVPEEELSLIYTFSDFNIVKIVDHEDFSATVPSKLYTIMGHGNIPVFIGPEGETKEIISSVDSKFCFRSDNMSSLFPFCSSLDDTEIDRMKKRFYEYAKSHFDREKQAIRYLSALSTCLEKNKN